MNGSWTNCKIPPSPSEKNLPLNKEEKEQNWEKNITNIGERIKSKMAETFKNEKKIEGNFSDKEYIICKYDRKHSKQALALY